MTPEIVRELFDYRDGRLYWKVKPSRKIHAGAEAGHINPNGYLRILFRGKPYSAHRLVFLWHHGYLPEFVDHINGRRTDNRIENLRPATRVQNQQNSRKPRNNTSGVKGVYWSRAAKKWQTQCRVNGTKYYLGRFVELTDAARAVRLFREKHHGAFTNHGEPQ